MLAGCFSTSIAQMPEALPAGEGQFGVGVGLATSRRSEQVALAPEISARYGVVERLELAAKTNFTHVEGQLKGQLIDGDFDLSLALAAATSKDPDTDSIFDEDADHFDRMLSGRALLLAGQRLGSGVDLVVVGSGLIGKRSAREFGYGQAWHGRFAGVGGGVGILLRGRACFMPEFVFTRIVAGAAPDFVESLRQGDVIVQVALTGMVGGGCSRAPP